MGTYTTNYNLFMPTIGEQGWGELVNGNFSTIDTTMEGLDTRIETLETETDAIAERVTTLEAGGFENINCTGIIAADKIYGKRAGVATLIQPYVWSAKIDNCSTVNFGQAGKDVGAVRTTQYNFAPTNIQYWDALENGMCTYSFNLSCGNVYTGSVATVDVIATDYVTGETYTHNLKTTATSYDRTSPAKVDVTLPIMASLTVTLTANIGLGAFYLSVSKPDAYIKPNSI